jgi:hypothetical protein
MDRPPARRREGYPALASALTRGYPQRFDQEDGVGAAEAKALQVIVLYGLAAMGVPAASPISAATVCGCEMSGRWLDLISGVFAFMRLA